jgi:mRNA interferase RelE/StbE
MTFNVKLIPRVKKDLAKLPVHDIRMIPDSLVALSNDNEPWRRVKKLKGLGDTPIYSFRVGSYRIILAIEMDIMVIFVIEIHQRKNAYSNF